jgi:hypothetical protein
MAARGNADGSAMPCSVHVVAGNGFSRAHVQLSPPAHQLPLTMSTTEPRVKRKPISCTRSRWVLEKPDDLTIRYRTAA